MHRRCSMFVETRWHDVELRLPIRTDCDELRNGAAIGSLVASDLAKTVRTNVVRVASWRRPHKEPERRDRFRIWHDPETWSDLTYRGSGIGVV